MSHRSSDGAPCSRQTVKPLLWFKFAWLGVRIPLGRHPQWNPRCSIFSATIIEAVEEMTSTLLSISEVL